MNGEFHFNDMKVGFVILKITLPSSLGSVRFNAYNIHTYILNKETRVLPKYSSVCAVRFFKFEIITENCIYTIRRENDTNKVY